LMRNDPDDQAKRSVRALRDELRDADDGKIRRVLAIVDEAADPTFNQKLLGSLRPRLAMLRPARPTRFARLLLMPLDSLIVPAPAWRPGEPVLPRTILASVIETVRAGLGGDTGVIDKIIAGCGRDEALALTRAGEALWPRAAEILAAAPLPAGWPETGLRPEIWPHLAQSIAAVLRRASQLRRLARDQELGAVELDEDQVNVILRHTAGEPPEACAMIVHLILVRAPHAAQLLRRIVSSNRSPAEKIVLRQAIDRAMERMLSGMEVPAAFTHDIGVAGLAGATAQLRQMTTLLREIEQRYQRRRSAVAAAGDSRDVGRRVPYAVRQRDPRRARRAIERSFAAGEWSRSERPGGLRPGFARPGGGGARGGRFSQL